MKNYEKPIIEINKFESEDEIMLSGGGFAAGKFRETNSGINNINILD